jgi:hypothetical protein
MKIFKSIFLSIMVITICFIINSCLGESYIHEEFLIKVDSIHVTDTAASNVPFDIEFFGTIGLDGCYYFTRYYQTSNNNDIIIEAWGSYDNKDRKCPAVKVTLDGHTYNTTIPHPGIYNIKVTQPDYSYLVKQITVN